MGKEAGYVYFEADCTSNGLNPFVPLDSANPTLAAFQQKPLKVFSFIFHSDIRIFNFWAHVCTICETKSHCNSISTKAIEGIS